MENLIIAQNVADPAQSTMPNNPDTTQSTMNPPNAVPNPGVGADGGLMIGVTGLWLLALVIAFAIFAVTPKLYKKYRRPASP